MILVLVPVFLHGSPTNIILELVPLFSHAAPFAQKFSLFTPLLEQVDPR